MLLLSIFVIIIVLQEGFSQSVIRNVCCKNYCYSTDKEKPQRKHFSSKTSYSTVKGVEYGRQYAVPFCKPVKFWLLSRHGTRLPEDYMTEKLKQLESLRDEIITNYELWSTQPTIGALCPEDLKLIKNWRLDKNVTVEYSKFLTIQGWNDMKFLAKSYQRIFPDLLSSKYDTEKFLFRYADNQRNEASFKAFVEGLFGIGVRNNISKPILSERDILLAPHKECPPWIDQAKRTNDPGSEIDRFKKSAVMNRTILHVSTRLGFQYPLEHRTIQFMWDMCRYEHAWFVDSPSAWCMAFTLADHQVLEYLQDLRYSYKAGYASDINSNIPCEIVQDMLRHFSCNRNPQVVAYFTDSTLVQLFLVALGAFKDEILLSSSNYQEMADRKWRTSFMVPFGANIAAVKYDCSRDRQDASPKVKFFLNQRPLELDWCNSGMCKWSDLISKNDKYWKSNCIKVFCGNSANSFNRSIFVLVSSFIFYTVLCKIWC